jgi:hypothetical protein
MSEAISNLQLLAAIEAVGKRSESLELANHRSRGLRAGGRGGAKPVPLALPRGWSAIYASQSSATTPVIYIIMPSLCRAMSTHNYHMLEASSYVTVVCDLTVASRSTSLCNNRSRSYVTAVDSLIKAGLAADKTPGADTDTDADAITADENQDVAERKASSNV